MERRIPEIKCSAAQVCPADDFPEVTVFAVEISREDHTWLESFSTDAEMWAFLKGVQAGSAMTGGPHVPIPFDIPTAR